MFRELKALLASTRFSTADCMAYTTVLMPVICPPHSCMQPEAAGTSGLATNSISLAIIHWEVSPMPYGQTEGCLSRVINWQARRGETLLGST